MEMSLEKDLAPEMIIDVREIEPRDRHRLIFETLDSLTAGQRLLIMVDHDPKPLYYQLMAEKQGLFDWEYLEQGPELWRVLITRTR